MHIVRIILSYIVPLAAFFVTVLWVDRDAKRNNIKLGAIDCIAICFLWPISLMGYFFIKDRKLKSTKNNTG